MALIIFIPLNFPFGNFGNRWSNMWRLTLYDFGTASFEYSSMKCASVLKISFQKSHSNGRNFLYSRSLEHFGRQMSKESWLLKSRKLTVNRWKHEYRRNSFGLVLLWHKLLLREDILKKFFRRQKRWFFCNFQGQLYLIKISKTYIGLDVFGT